MRNDPTYFALVEACAQPGCPVCRLEQQSVERYLDHLFYENVNDGGLRAHLRASLGFCREHTHLLLQAGAGDALGMSIIYHDVFGAVLSRLSGENSLVGQPTAFSRLLGRIPAELAAALERAKQAVRAQQICLACQQREITAHMVLEVLLASIQEQEMLAAFTKSEGLCLPHLHRAFEQPAEGAGLARLFSVELEKMERLRGELGEFIRKSDYRFLKNGFGAEGNAWRRAAGLAAGAWSGRQETERSAPRSAPPSSE